MDIVAASAPIGLAIQGQLVGIARLFDGDAILALMPFAEPGAERRIRIGGEGADILGSNPTWGGAARGGHISAGPFAFGSTYHDSVRRPQLQGETFLAGAAGVVCGSGSNDLG